MTSARQADLQRMIVLEKIQSRFPNPTDALTWYHEDPLPGFAGLTAKNLVEQGRLKDVLTYIEAMDSGVFA